LKIIFSLVAAPLVKILLSTITREINFYLTPTFNKYPLCLLFKNLHMFDRCFVLFYKTLIILYCWFHLWLKMSNQLLSSLGKRKAGWATHWTLTQHPESSNSPPDAVSWHHPSPPDGDLASSNSSPNGDMASSNSRPNGDPGSSHSRPDGDPWTSNSPPLLRDTPTDPQAATREGILSTRLAALS